MKTLTKLLLALSLLLFAVPIRADELKGVVIQAIFGDTTPTSNGFGSAESVDASLEFDRTTQTVVPDSVHVNSFGTLGTFTFAGLTIGSTPQPQFSPDVVTNFSYRFAWDDLSGDSLILTVANILVPTGPTPIPVTTHWLDLPGMSGPNLVGWNWLTLPRAGGDFLYPDEPIPTPTPEPRTVIMICAGLIGILIASKL